MSTATDSRSYAGRLPCLTPPHRDESIAAAIVAGLRTVLLYVAAAAAYIVLGVLVPELLFSWFVGVAFLLFAVWVLPELVRRRR